MRIRARSSLVVLVLLGALGVARLGAVDGQERYTFFYVVNAAGRPVQVVASADGTQLFAVSLDAGAGATPPTREVKVPLRLDARSLVVEDIDGGLRAGVDLSQAPDIRRGFRIVVTPSDITITRDYVPIRTR